MEEITYLCAVKQKKYWNMNGILDYKCSNYDDWKRFSYFKSSECGFTLTELVKGTKEITEFCERFNVSSEWLVREVTENPLINEEDIFDYGVFKTPFLVGKKAVWTEKWVKEGSERKLRRCYHDVYVTTHQFADLTLNRIAESAIKHNFPWLFEKPFLTEARRFNEGFKKINMKTRLSDIEDMVDEIGWMDDYTLGDFLEALKNPDEIVSKPAFAVYADGYIFVELEGSENALFLKSSDLVNKDWNAVLERKVYSIKKPNGGWFEGKQGDAPYFNLEDERIKKVMEMLN